ncbi:CAZyme family CE10 [Penicillium verhagenii]|uniref:CAZyme family CE10 n=1 Tax=Penicillium verhagenii TaxID=1562060 RepID=UPI0025456E2A|nr:CAZyme family CE10 [Penicillium verhagenii]KAJ5938508.1 CAZyme family CE10 [Penicillium verhagenii]
MLSFLSLRGILFAILICTPTSVGAHLQTDNTVVDLTYATYRGYYNSTTGLNVFLGIRYATPPVGRMRWQAPQPPIVNRTTVIPANNQPPLCPQSGAAQLPRVYGFNSDLGDEDCLFLNVYAPPRAENVPVLVWIHGGGYGLSGAVHNPSEWINTNDNGFISVMIQYRLGAFGFLSSADVAKYGQTNVGLLDMRLALEWVQAHISQFGGDPFRVTIGGESAGAGAAILQAMAYGGREDHLFNNIIASSPYIVTQYQHDDEVPTGHYQAFARQAGCLVGDNSASPQTFACLVETDTNTLQNASGFVSASGAWGTFAFLPVIDGELIRELPSKQLLEKKVSGKRVLSGNNANDGVPLSLPYVETTADFMTYVKGMFPQFIASDLSRLLEIYGFASSSPGPFSPLFDTLGDHGLTAVNQSEFATGYQQTVYNIFAETAFDCPSYWLMDAFSGKKGKESWKYQYSVTPAYHGADLTAYFSVDTTTPTRGIRHAVQKILGSFIIKDSPVVSIQDAKGGASDAIVPENSDGHILWPMWNDSLPIMMDLNTTGGNLLYKNVTRHLAFWLREDPGVVNHLRLANANRWEGGRGERCRFWREVGPRVPQ